jgi:hypothetical protein
MSSLSVMFYTNNLKLKINNYTYHIYVVVMARTHSKATKILSTAKKVQG